MPWVCYWGWTWMASWKLKIVLLFQQVKHPSGVSQTIPRQSCHNTQLTRLLANSYSSRLLGHLREVQTPDSIVGIYLSTHNGGFATRVCIDLLTAVEKVTGRGRGLLLVHDVSRSVGGDLSVKAYRLSEGAREAAKKGRWDTAA